MAITLFKSQINVQDKKGHRDYIHPVVWMEKYLNNKCLGI